MRLKHKDGEHDTQTAATLFLMDARVVARQDQLDKAAADVSAATERT